MKEINPETLGVRPITAEEIFANRKLADSYYDVSADTEIRNIRRDYGREAVYIFALQGMDHAEEMAKIRERIASLPPVKAPENSEFPFA